MSYNNDEFDKELKGHYLGWHRAAHQVPVQVLNGLVRWAGSRSRSRGPTGGFHMEMFLRYNFGVQYFPPLFSLVNNILLSGGLYLSGQALFFSPGATPGGLAWAGSLFVTSILFLIPWVTHSLSILRRRNDVTGQHSQYPGDARLDDLNRWVQRRFAGRREMPLVWMRHAMAWVCADDLRRDFIGETLAGIGIAYVMGWLCFDRYVTDFLLVSLVLLQFKRWNRNARKLEQLRMQNDARREMEGRNL